MDRLKKRAIALALSLVLMFFGLIVYAAKGLQADLPTCLPYKREIKQGAFQEIGPNRYQVDVVAFMWGFDMDKSTPSESHAAQS